MTEQEREEPLADVDRADAEVRQSGSNPRSPNEKHVTSTDQAVSNQAQALESGEENAV
jgi:hypothetical protein